MKTKNWIGVFAVAAGLVGAKPSLAFDGAIGVSRVSISLGYLDEEDEKTCKEITERLRQRVLLEQDAFQYDVAYWMNRKNDGDLENPSRDTADCIVELLSWKVENPLKISYEEKKIRRFGAGGVDRCDQLETELSQKNDVVQFTRSNFREITRESVCLFRTLYLR